jgi:ribosomal protein L20A (L18A)
VGEGIVERATCSEMGEVAAASSTTRWMGSRHGVKRGEISREQMREKVRLAISR